MDTGYRGKALSGMNRRGASGRTRRAPRKATAHEPHSLPPTQAPVGPQLGRRHRPCFVSMATGSARSAPNITRCGKHAARGTPPQPRSGQRPEGARGCRGHVQFGKSPQSPPSRTRCPSPQALRVCGGSRLYSAQAPRLSPARLDGSPAPWPGPPQDEPAAARLRSPRPHLRHSRRLSGRKKPRLPWGLPRPPSPVAREAAAGGGPCREGGHF